MKCFVLFATLATMASASSIYGVSPYGAPAIRTSFSAPISALNAYPGAVNAYAAGAYAAPLAVAPVAAAAFAAPIAAAAYAAPVAAPLVAPLAIGNAVGPVSSQFHKQDELGNFEYGYNDINSAKHEAGNAYTGVRGSYTVNDGLATRRVDYVADDFGFRQIGK